MDTLISIIWFFIIFGLVVVSHEFGHFLLAKVNGIKVLEFFVGMGPTLWSFQKGDTKYSLKLFPIGGACMFEGEDGMENEEGKELSDGAFTKANVWSRISTVVAGPLFNFILAFIVALIMVNMIVIRDPVATEVVADSAAMEAGLQNGDRIVAIDGEKVYLYNELLMYTQLYSGGEVEVTYERDGELYNTKLIPRYDEGAGRYLFGISNSEIVELKGLDGVKYAWYEIRYNVKMTYKSLGMMIQGKVEKENVAGPVGIAVNVVGKTYEQAKEQAQGGTWKDVWANILVNMMNITLMLSVNLGILNLLPLPALDGGRLVFLFLEVLRGKPIPPEKEGMVHFIGLVFFMILMVVVLFNDINNIFL
ncbi:MAG: RIP metalloprotease RseP [Lachnospiraceae bacterium]|nr:RIP metalloprotease RseP [Lachnospiraceae bacterium]